MQTGTESIFQTGIVESYDDRSGYGYIRPDRSDSLGEPRLYLVHRHSLRSRTSILERGDRVIFSTTTVPTGILAMDVHFPDDDNGEKTIPDESMVTDEVEPSTTPSAEDWLARALVARSNRQIEDSINYYETGLKQSPSMRLILSYAAMLKNIGRRQMAMRVYERGIEAYPTSAKLHEDAGVMAASLGDTKRALIFLQEALDLCRNTKQGGEKGVLLAMAKIYFRRGTVPDLREAYKLYQEARKLFQKMGGDLPKADMLSLSLAGIQTKHHRGYVTVSFLNEIEGEIVRAWFLKSDNEWADLVISIRKEEFKASYGIERPILVRCMFKNDVTLDDLKDFDENIQEQGKSGLVDDEVAFIVVSSVPEDLQRILWKRIEEKNRFSAVIIPLPQSEIEKSTATQSGSISSDTLRSILDRWLYRRDLFAGNRPVVGRRFFGRDKPLAELRDAIDTMTCAGVYGLRKVGKTSLLKETERRLVEGGDLVAYVDLLRLPAEVTDCGWLYWYIVVRLRQGVIQYLGRFSAVHNFTWRLGKHDDFLDIPPGFKIAIAFDSDVTRLLKVLGTLQLNPRPRIVVLLDEIERLLPNRLGKPGMSGYFDLFSYFRGINQQGENFVVIATGANAAFTEAAQFDGRDNPVFNFFKSIYLPLLERTECDTMIRELGRGMGIRFQEKALANIFDLTGGHPFFTRQLCSFIAHRFERRPLSIEQGMVKSLVDTYLTNKGSDFQEIIERLRRDFPDEAQLCVRLAHAGGSLPLSELRGRGTEIALSTSILHLTGYQLVAVKDNRAYLTVELFSRWLRKIGE